MTLANYITTYNLPEKMGQILEVLERNYRSKITISFYQSADLTQYGAAYQGLNRETNIATINLPLVGQNGRPAINSVDGKLTYATYDSTFAYVHEINHMIMDLMGINNRGDSELNIAVMAIVDR